MGYRKQISGGNTYNSLNGPLPSAGTVSSVSVFRDGVTWRIPDSLSSTKSFVKSLPYGGRTKPNKFIPKSEGQISLDSKLLLDERGRLAAGQHLNRIRRELYPHP